MVSKEDGRLLLKIARQSVESVFSKLPYNLDLKTQKQFSERAGVFVTLYKGRDLRGCIGFVEPVYSIGEAVIEAARSAAFRDPRFMPVAKDELKQIRFEVSILTVPEEISVADAGGLKQIRIGKDGLMVRLGMNSGLLLPSVAVEHKWSAEQFIMHACEKSGLPPEAWSDPACHVYKFQAQVFREQ